MTVLATETTPDWATDWRRWDGSVEGRASRLRLEVSGDQVALVVEPASLAWAPEVVVWVRQCVDDKETP
jgi:hypothetical protein